jgi:peptidoglycan/LPS O-acetylase OafA/YrhL
MAVLFSHLFNFNVTKHLFIGVAGVDLFFVISGFLITEILLRYKNSDATLQQSLKKFYIRRFFRIFPIYYLYLLIVSIFLFSDAKLALPWAYSYTYNIYAQNHEGPNYLVHLWSLSVEEQFYLFWPFIILVIPQKIEKKFIIFSILLSIILRISIPWLNHKLFTFSCLDAFGLGALFAYFKRNNIEYLQKIISFKLPFYVAMGLYILMIIASYFNQAHYFNIWFRLIISIISVYCIGFAIFGKSVLTSNWFLQILDNKKMQFLGTISYGIYIYHLLVYYFLKPYSDKLFEYCFIQKIPSLKFLFYNRYLFDTFFYTLLSIFIAQLSFKFLETPILNFKNKIS